MLAKANRLQKKKDFELLFEKGKKAGSRLLVLAYKKREDETPSRIGVIVSKKQEKSAVKRNRARRQARELLKDFLTKLPKGYDFALVLKAGFLPLSYDEKKEAIEYVFKKAGVLQ